MIEVTDIAEMPAGKMLFASETDHFEIYIVDEVLDDSVRLKKAQIGSPGTPVVYSYETILKKELFTTHRWFTRKGF
ncbi:MAG: hypothetical protein JWN76_3808 [Chitinophagaceae bacterium]|nr:hypothetical protein [Chitinophagaceae bacterium]